MPKQVFNYFLIVSLLWLVQAGNAQSHDVANSHAEFTPGARITGVLAYSLIDNSFSPESNNILVVPTLGLNIDYYLSEKWGLGVHSDLLLQQFKVENHGVHAEIVRENPIALCAMGLYRPVMPLAIIMGYGVEIEKHENLQLLRVGAEYGMHLSKKWEVCLSLEYDIKLSAYNSLMFGVGFSLGLD